jgi:hypothetical protein
MGGEAFHLAWTDGESLSIERAIDEALQVVDAVTD